MAKRESVQKKLQRIRPPRVQLTYDVEVGDAKEIKELPFVVGVLPLAVSTGAGANSRIAIGTGIVGGTLTATILGIFMIPLFYVLIRKLFKIKIENPKEN